ncbi:MAG: DUF6809 family protein [Clostridia bacterium]
MQEKEKEIEKRKRELLNELALLYGYDFKEEKPKVSKEEIEEKRKVNVRNYLEGFYKEFKIYKKEITKEIPLLINLYEEFLQEVYNPSDRYKLALKIINEINENIEKTFSEEQQELMKQFKECQDIMIDDMVQEAFVYGYAMASELKEEVINKYSVADVDKK